MSSEAQDRVAALVADFPAPQPPPPLTHESPEEKDLDSALYEFLVVYVHAVSYVCGVYPSSVYKLARYGNCAVYECQHGGVKEWIETSCKQALATLREAGYHCTLAVIVVQDGEVLQRFGLQVERVRLPQPESDNVQTQRGRKERLGLESAFGHAVPQFENCLRQLLVADVALPPGNKQMALVYSGQHLETAAWAESRYKRVSGPVRVVESAVLEQSRTDNKYVSMNLFISL